MKYHFIIVVLLYTLRNIAISKCDTFDEQDNVKFESRDAIDNKEKRTIGENENLSIINDDDNDESADTCEKERSLIVYYNFESEKSGHSRVSDKSGCFNNGIMDTGAMIFTNVKGSCGKSAYTWNHDIRIPASSFQNPPRIGFTVSMWVSFTSKRKNRVLFYAKGPHFGSLVLEVNLPNIIWSYCETNCTCIFTSRADNVVTINSNKAGTKFMHIAATYDAVHGYAQIYVNGEIMSRAAAQKNYPFKYWGNDVRVGGNVVGKPIEGLIDEFKLFSYAVESKDIDILSNTCRFYESTSTKRNEIPYYETSISDINDTDSFEAAQSSMNEQDAQSEEDTDNENNDENETNSETNSEVDEKTEDDENNTSHSNSTSQDDSDHNQDELTDDDEDDTTVQDATDNDTNLKETDDEES